MVEKWGEKKAVFEGHYGILQYEANQQGMQYFTEVTAL